MDQNQNPWQPGQPIQPNQPAGGWPPQPATHQPANSSQPSAQPQHFPAGQAPVQPGYQQPYQQAGTYAAPRPPGLTRGTIYQPAQPYQPQYTNQSVYLPQPDLSGQLAAPPRRKRRIFLALLVTLIVLGAAAGGTYLFLVPKTTGPTPDQILQTALSSALSTRSLTQTTSIGAGGDTETVVAKFGLADSRDPRIDATDTVVNNKKTIAKVEGYGTSNNTYAMLSDVAGASDSVLNKWVQIRTDGTMPTGISQSDTLYQNYDPRYALLGQALFGNISSSDRQALVNYMVQNHVYQYDSTRVVRATVNGAPAYRYAVTLQHFDQLEQKAAKVFGITDAAAIKEASTAVPNGTKLVMYVTTATPRLVKVAMGGNITIQYDHFNTTTLPKEPQATVSYDAFVTALGGTPAAPTTADDTRTAALTLIQQQIDNYFNTIGDYPTLTEMNDSTWLQVNMPDLKQSTIQDPGGTSPTFASKPTKNQYAYQPGVDTTLATCEADESTCGAYVLTATLSDGTTDVLTSPT